MPELKTTTIKQLISFAETVTQKGLLGELKDSIHMDKSDPYINTYLQAILMHDFVEDLKKQDPEEWSVLQNCKLRHWVDPREDGDAKSFEIIVKEMISQNRCISDCMATVARFLYEEVDEKYFDSNTKKLLKISCTNEEVDINWTIRKKPYIVHISKH